MNRKALIIILLVISWPVNNIHRLLNTYPETWGYWYPFSPLCKEELQWHVHAICECISYLCVFIGIRIYMTILKGKDADVNSIFNSILILQIIDLFHYLGWHRRCEFVLFIEGVFFAYTILRIFIKKYKHGSSR